MSSITVRQAVFSDLPSLAELFNQYRVFQGKASDLPAALSSWHQKALRRLGSHSCIPATPLRLLPGSSS